HHSVDRDIWLCQDLDVDHDSPSDAHRLVGVAFLHTMLAVIGRALPGRLLQAIPHSLALVATPPAFLPAARRVRRDGVVIPVFQAVFPARRALSSGAAGERQTLALLASAPVRFSRQVRYPAHQAVVITPDLAVLSLGRTGCRSVACVPQPLTI